MNLKRKPESRSTNPQGQNRVVVTGIGAITPVGNTMHDSWQAFINGQSGVVQITLIDMSRYGTKVGGEIKNFDPSEFLPRKKLRHMTFATQVAVIATEQAIADSGLDLDQEDREKIGVIIGTSAASTVDESEKATRQLLAEDARKLSPFQVLRFWPNMQSFWIAEINNLKGYNSTVCTACAAGTQAIGDAATLIKSGAAEVMIAGASEFMVAETVMAGFSAMRALSTSYTDEPEKAMKPFDKNREGFVPAIGGAVMILESLDHAKARDANIYGEILGSGVSSDAYHMIVPDPEGIGAALAIRRALEDAHVSVEDIDYINAHGTATPLGDLAETIAIKSVFGSQAYNVPISSTKSMIGHMMGATGAVEAAVCLMTIRDGIIHPTINLETPDPECDLDFVPNVAREVDVDITLSNSFGLGGQNACLVLGRI
ncbi:MAG: 3-oxoacyl-ACP synthase [Anaerolineae bacterium SM23_ 63]|nr:MAG: 3-oxoacyl-ACP synthase [Anaerolineae bacterium SM23_ 63]HEY45759.1 beta-ketoacyl-ACP synthase II [Anaerolineae bacterium]